MSVEKHQKLSIESAESQLMIKLQANALETLRVEALSIQIDYLYVLYLIESLMI